MTDYIRRDLELRLRIVMANINQDVKMLESYIGMAIEDVDVWSEEHLQTILTGANDIDERLDELIKKVESLEAAFLSEKAEG